MAPGVTRPPRAAVCPPLEPGPRISQTPRVDLQAQRLPRGGHWGSGGVTTRKPASLAHTCFTPSLPAKSQRTRRLCLFERQRSLFVNQRSGHGFKQPGGGGAGTRAPASRPSLRATWPLPAARCLPPAREFPGAANKESGLGFGLINTPTGVTHLGAEQEHRAPAPAHSRPLTRGPCAQGREGPWRRPQGLGLPSPAWGPNPLGRPGSPPWSESRTWTRGGSGAWGPGPGGHGRGSSLQILQVTLSFMGILKRMSGTGGLFSPLPLPSSLPSSLPVSPSFSLSLSLSDLHQCRIFIAGPARGAGGPQRRQPRAGPRGAGCWGPHPVRRPVRPSLARRLRPQDS